VLLLDSRIRGNDGQRIRGNDEERIRGNDEERAPMTPTTQGAIVIIVTLLVLFSGIPVAFGLGAISIVFLLIFHGFSSLHIVAETFYGGLDDFTLVAIPMFVMMGAAIGSSPAGKDLYEALDRWLYRLPGGLVISNIGACALFAALTGSSPACCAAIGKMGIPEMRRRGYPDEIATGSICAGGTLGILIPPSITFILYGIATETSIGRLFLAGVMPGILLTALFMLWTLFAIWRRGVQTHAPGFRFTWRQKFQSVPKIAPFLAIIVAVMYALYGGIATPSEAAGVGAAFCVVLAVVIYRMWHAKDWWQILRDTMRESVMILMIIAAAVLFGYMLTSLYLTQTLAQSIADAHFNKWALMAMINVFLLVCGFFIPPAAIILMTSPILFPIVTAAGFDPVWFGVILTINMEIGLIHPPVGLNIYIVNAIAPDVPVQRVMWGTLPYVACMMLAIVILCVFPQIATWLPDTLMGPGH
jgi:tripartite ATP-independent transporter DctM subunit